MQFKNNTVFTPILFLLLGFLAVTPAYSQMNEQDSLALVAFYNQMDGVNWTDNTNWLSAEPVSNWYGVRVANDRVVAVELDSNAVAGTIPPEFWQLQFLTHLDLRANALTDTLNAEIGQLDSLRYLDLSQNDLSGALSDSLSHLLLLDTLNLSFNGFTGELPAALDSLTALSLIDLSHNQLQGQVAFIDTAFHALRHLDLSVNDFDSLADLSALDSLNYMKIDSNALTFASIEPNIRTAIDYTIIYTPQDSIGLVQDTTVEVGQPVTFEVVVDGSANSYQWLKDGVAISGAESALLETLAVTLDDSGEYVCQITNSIATDLTLYSQPKKLTVVPPPPPSPDSLAVIDFYNSTGGPGWLNNSNWLNADLPLSEWYGITMQADRVIAIELPANNLIGTVPAELDSLTALQTLRLADNDLTFMADLSAITTLTTCDVSDNAMQFDSIEPNIAIAAFNYSPQDSVGAAHDSVYVFGSELHFTVSVAGASNAYQWLKNGAPITGANAADFIVPVATEDDSGSYWCQVANTIATNLVISSRPQKVSVLPPTDPTQIDSMALVHLYRATDGDSWTNNTNWLTDQPLSTWYKVTVKNGRVSQLHLKNNNLVGYLPTRMSQLTALIKLNLSGNNLQGEIPPFIALYTKLKELDLSKNTFTGGIPIVLYQLPKLEVLELQENALSGSLPAAIGQADKLRQLVLYKNKFEGDLPEELYQLTSLKSLDLSYNEFTGSVISTIKRMEDLLELYLNNNHFSGVLPAGIGELSALNYLMLDNNNFEGGVPSSYTNLSQLKHLSIDHNDLIDVPDLSGIATFEALYVDNNRLTFEDIEPNLGVQGFRYAPQDSVGQEQEGCVRVGDPKEIPLEPIGGVQNEYQWLFNGNEIDGATDSVLVFAKSKWEDDGVYHCRITNTQATALTLYSRPFFLEVKKNYVLSRTDSLALLELYRRTGGANWTDNTGWKTSAPIRDWYGLTVVGEHITEIKLNNNNLTGQLPDELANMTELVNIEVTDNNLSGVIPAAWANALRLKYIVLENNNIGGSLPPELGDLQSLIYLNINNNNISGEFPQELWNPVWLTYLYMADNEISGVIPDITTRKPVLRQVYMPNNHITGLPDFAALPKLDSLIVFSNRLGYEALELNNDILNFEYIPQDSLGNEETLVIPAGDTLRVSAGSGGAHTAYQWYRDGQVISGATSEKYVYPTPVFEEAFTLTCELTNSKIDDLDLSRRPIHVQVSTTILFETDSLAVIALYDSTDGANWTTQSNWTTTEPLNTWYGVTVENGRVVAIDLVNNNLNGCVPAQITQISQLNRLDLHGNVLNRLADLTSLASLQELKVQNNKLTFADLETNRTVTGLVYAPQDTVEMQNEIIVAAGDSAVFAAGSAGSATQYQWFRDGVQLTGETAMNYVYHAPDYSVDFSVSCVMTNTLLPDLTLYRALTQVHVSTAALLTSDSLAIVALYDSTDGANWLHKENWLDEDKPLSDWFGVYLKKGRIVALELAANNLVGEVPPAITGIGHLRTLRLNNNAITTLPALTGMDSLALIAVENNALEFASLEANAGLAGLTYIPQDSLGVPVSYDLEDGESQELVVEATGSANSYQWFLNGTVIDGATDSTYTIMATDSSIAGKYSCRVTSTIVTDLELWSQPATVSYAAPTTGVEELGVPTVFALTQNYPNPFNPQTRIAYDLPKSGVVTLKIYSSLGREVKTLVKGRQNAGRHVITFDASQLAGGIYFYQIKVGNDFKQTKKMLFLK